MTVIRTSNPPNVLAQVKAKGPKRSRGGCKNCKIRKIRCDESKPSCKKCESYNTYCSYDSTYSDLQPLHGLQMQLVHGVADITPVGPGDYVRNGYPLSAESLDLLQKFHTRTVMSLGRGSSKAIDVYKSAFATLAFAVSISRFVIYSQASDLDSIRFFYTQC